MNAPMREVRAGRMCPRDYRYSPAVFDRSPELHSEIVYVVGGLYGNLTALDAIEAMAAREARPVTIVVNGDFHWFDAEAKWFETIDARVARHHVLRGNVETEIARADDIGAGCGCAYPTSVAIDIVQRSNAILGELRAVVEGNCAARLASLPMHLVAEVGGLRIGIVHGDATSLAGWGFAHDRLTDAAAQANLRALHATSTVDVFASTHTCGAALCDVSGHDRLTVINNGAAGIANFSGSTYGLISRIAIHPSPHRSVYGLIRDGVHVDALPVHFDVPAFLERFLTRWPEHSPAHISYFNRIVDGPDHRVTAATFAAAAAA